MKNFSKLILQAILTSLVILISIGGFNKALAEIKIQDTLGTVTLDKPAKRVVVLEYSFADALIRLQQPAIGMADDNAPEKLLPEMLAGMPNYVSVGMRPQPSLEKIAELKPDLIIADLSRHQAVLDQLRQIAPTIILNSLFEDYATDLDNARKIAMAIGKEDLYQEVLTQHKATIKELMSGLEVGKYKAVYLASSENKIRLNSDDSYVGSILKEVGFQTVAKPETEAQGRYFISLEQLAVLSPDILITAIQPHTDKKAITQVWKAQNNPVYMSIPAVKNNRVFVVDPNIWARARGFITSEIVVRELAKLLREVGISK